MVVLCLVKKAIRKYIEAEYNIWWSDELSEDQIEINHYGNNEDSTLCIEIDTTQKKERVKAK